MRWPLDRPQPRKRKLAERTSGAGNSARNRLSGGSPVGCSYDWLPHNCYCFHSNVSVTPNRAPG
jgi:hypothetical protein